MDEESRGETMLPINFLRQLIGMYGDSMQSMVPQYLEASLETLQRNQTQFRDALAGALTGGPLAELTRRNMELFQKAAGAGRGAAGPTESAEPEQNGRDDEVARLKAQLAELQAKVDKLG
jgi:polyhydroxyalkanoate synthesis regulator protein